MQRASKARLASELRSSESSASAGGSVVRALLKDGIFTPRVVTRNPNGDAAKALVALGAEVVQGDFADLATLKAAISGAEVVYAVRTFVLIF